VVTILSAVACFHSSSHAQAVRISYSGLSGQNLPFWLTYEDGLYKKYGLNAEMVLISGGLTNMQAVMAKEIAFTYLGGASPIQAIAQGADIVVLATAYGLMPYGLIASKNIHAAAELKGKDSWFRASAGLRRPGLGWRSIDWASARAMYRSYRLGRTRCASPRSSPARPKQRCSRRRDFLRQLRAVSICSRISAL
jgi:hypothetical protein